MHVASHSLLCWMHLGEQELQCAVGDMNSVKEGGARVVRSVLADSGQDMVLSRAHPSPSPVRQSVYLWMVIKMSRSNLQLVETVMDMAGRTRRSLNGHLNFPCDCTG